MHCVPGVRRCVSRERCAGLRDAAQDATLSTAIAAAIAILFFGLVAYAKMTGHWDTNIPRAVYMQLVPGANEATHPGL